MESLLISPSPKQSRARLLKTVHCALSTSSSSFLAQPRTTVPLFYTICSTDKMSWRHDVAWQPDDRHWSICFATHWLMAGIANIIGAAVCIASWYMLWRAKNPCEYYDGLIGGTIIGIATLYGIVLTILPKTTSRHRRLLVFVSVILTAASAACALVMVCVSFVKLFASPTCVMVAATVPLNLTTTTTEDFTRMSISSTSPGFAAILSDAGSVASSVTVKSSNTPINIDYADPLLWQYGMLTGSCVTFLGTLLCLAASVTEHISTRLLLRVQKVVDSSMNSNFRPIRGGRRAFSGRSSESDVALAPRISPTQLPILQTTAVPTTVRSGSLRQSTEQQHELLLQAAAARRSNTLLTPSPPGTAVRTSEVVLNTMSPRTSTNAIQPRRSVTPANPPVIPYTKRTTILVNEDDEKDQQMRRSERYSRRSIETPTQTFVVEKPRTSHRHHRRHHRRHHHRDNDNNNERRSGRRTREDDEVSVSSESDISSIGPEPARPSAATAASLPMVTERTVTTTQRRSTEPVAGAGLPASGRLSLQAPRASLQPTTTVAPGGRTTRESFTSRLSYQR